MGCCVATNASKSASIPSDDAKAPDSGEKTAKAIPSDDAKAPDSAQKTANMIVTTIPTNATAPRKVAVILPGKKYAGLIGTDSQFAYHLLDEPTYSLLDPFGFDADVFVEDAIEYCRKNEIEGVFGFDCFPSMLASIVNQSLKLKGPSFQSVFLCLNKFYMRQCFSPDMAVTKFDPHTTVEPPKDFPVVVKHSDTQFYVGTWLLNSLADWEKLLKELQTRFTREYLDRRKKFYAKWHKAFGQKELAENWNDIVLFHVEPHLQGREHQVEVVVEENDVLIADTGDMIKTGDVLVMFVTPGSFELPKEWVHDIVFKLRDLGYRNQAMDVEFMFTDSGPQLVEINSRYSYMGWSSFFEHRCEEGNSSLDHKPDLRNLENRTLSCLGDAPTRFPCDEVISKLAIMMYTQKTGAIKDIMNVDFLEAQVKSGSVEAWAPKLPYLKGSVTEDDLRYPGGWAKLGCLLMTARRQDFEATNARIAEFQKNLFYSDSYILAQDDEIGYAVDKYAIQ